MYDCRQTHKGGKEEGREVGKEIKKQTYNAKNW